MNIDPRGYGVCKNFYKASREYTKKPPYNECKF